MRTFVVEEIALLQLCERRPNAKMCGFVNNFELLSNLLSRLTYFTVKKYSVVSNHKFEFCLTRYIPQNEFIFIVTLGEVRTYKIVYNFFFFLIMKLAR